MFPIATFLSRDCTIPYQLPGTNIVLEKGQRVIIPVPALQNDPRIYPQPHIFDPDRFQDNNHKPSATYLPFGDGPRICIGKQNNLSPILDLEHSKLLRYRKIAQFLSTIIGTVLQPLQEGFWLNMHRVCVR